MDRIANRKRWVMVSFQSLSVKSARQKIHKIVKEIPAAYADHQEKPKQTANSNTYPFCQWILYDRLQSALIARFIWRVIGVYAVFVDSIVVRGDNCFCC